MCLVSDWSSDCDRNLFFISRCEDFLRVCRNLRKCVSRKRRFPSKIPLEVLIAFCTADSFTVWSHRKRNLDFLIMSGAYATNWVRCAPIACCIKISLTFYLLNKTLMSVTFPVVVQMAFIKTSIATLPCLTGHSERGHIKRAFIFYEGFPSHPTSHRNWKPPKKMPY